MPELQQFSGIDGVAARDKLAQDEVASSANIDYSITRGAATVRQGSAGILTGVGRPSTTQLDYIFRHYNVPGGFGGSPWYLAYSNGECYRVTGGFGSPSAALLFSGGNTDENNITAFASYRDDVYIASDGVAVKDDGTNKTDWVLQSPGDPLVVTTGAALSDVTVINTYTLVEGTHPSLSTFTGTATATTDASSLRIELAGTPAATNLNTNGAQQIGDFGIHNVDLWFSEPKAVSRVSVDYSVGDTSFLNYLHAELDVTIVDDAQSDLETLIDATLDKDSAAGVHADVDAVADAKAAARQVRRPPRARFPLAKETYTTWSLPVPKFEFVGKDSSEGLTNIPRVRLVIECSAACEVRTRDWVIRGDEAHSLTDVAVGYAYWETYATVATVAGNQVILNESAPSSASSRLTLANNQIIIVSTNTPTGSTHGITHRLLYRMGGFLRDAYAVSTHALATETITDSLSDVEVLLQGNRLNNDIRASLPSPVRSIEAFKDRLFIGWDNQVGWSMPGQPGTYPNDSIAQVSHTADRVQGLFAAGNSLVIVNRESVYEMRGNEFEGASTDWVLERMPTKGGAIAPRATIKPPFGVLLVREEGLHLYQPGAGVDQPIVWAMEKIGDIFKGNNAADPAQQKIRLGDGINQSAIHQSVAAYKDDKIFFGFPSGAATRPNLMVVLDMRAKRAWLTSYPWSFRSLLSDRDSNTLLAGTVNGAFLRLDNGLADTDEVGSESLIVWNLTTRDWTAASDTVFENVFVEQIGGGNAQIAAVYDGTTTTTAGALTGATRQWQEMALDGTFANNMHFLFVGTATNASPQAVVYNLAWDALPEPRRRTFWRTEHDLAGHDNDKIWDVLFTDIDVTGASTVLGTVFVDNVAVMTQTVSGVTGGRIIAEQSFPVDTVGEVAYVVYSGTEFKHWKTRFAARPEPPKVNLLKTEYEAIEEHIVDAVDFDVNPNGTMTTTVFIDNIAVSTHTSASTTGRRSFTYSLPPETYGRTIHALHQGSGLKHFRTWFHKRLEPDRWDKFNTNRESGPNRRFTMFHADIDPLGGTATAIPTVDGVAVSTFTFAGNGRLAYAEEFPIDTTGKTIYTAWTSSANKFKHYETRYESVEQPEVVQLWQTVKTDAGWEGDKIWDAHITDIDVTGTGTVLGKVYVDSAIVATHTISDPTGGRVKDEFSLPMDTIGEIAYTEYTSLVVTGTVTTTANVDFQLWGERLASRNEPLKVNSFKTDPDSSEESIVQSIDIDANPNGTLTSIVYADGSAVGTFTSEGSNRQSFTHALPSDTFARTLWTEHTGASFKHYRTWYHRVQDPDRWTDFTTPRDSGDERWFRNLNADIDPLSNTVLAVVMVDAAVVTTATFTAGERRSFVEALPSETMGRTAYIIYSGLSGATFKHHQTWFDATPEPDRVKRFEWGPQTFPSQQFARTWIAELNPLGASVVGVLSLDGTAVSTSTFTGSIRTTYNVGIDMDGSNDPHSATQASISYTASAVFKHYSSELETVAKPFGKTSWTIPYVKIGGASKLELAESFEMDIETPNEAVVITSIWDVDEVATQTNTLTFVGREWRADIPFGPGIRGFIWRQRLIGDAPFQVWSSALNLQPVGVKGGVRRSIRGTPK